MYTGGIERHAHTCHCDQVCRGAAAEKRLEETRELIFLFREIHQVMPKRAREDEVLDNRRRANLLRMAALLQVLNGSDRDIIEREQWLLSEASAIASETQLIALAASDSRNTRA